MLKMYQEAIAAGSTSEYWDDSWDHASPIAEGARNCVNDPLFPLLDSTLQRDRLFLEGGCGTGHWVKQFHDRGYRAVGLDFASRTVDRLHATAPELDIRLGDIRELPFADGEVHTYFSNGVVEHFEDGPELALAEARRVMAPDGWFLCSVPDACFLRDRVLFSSEVTDLALFKPRMQVRRVDATRTEQADSLPFFQYAFTKAEFEEKLQRAGFRVERSFGYALLWGLLQIPGAQLAADGIQNAARRLRRAPQAAAAPVAVAPQEPVGEIRRGRLRELFIRALVKEDRQLPILGPLVGFAAEHCSNMRMFVARPG
jgi:SAM-dependent methyltransferase